MKKTNVLDNIYALKKKNLFRTNQEDGQLELVVEHHGVNAAGPREPGCYFTQEIGVKDEEEDARAWSGTEKKTEAR